MKIDAFAHAVPQAYREAVLNKVDRSLSAFQNWEKLKTLSDVNLRLAVMDEFGVDMQVVTAAPPSIEFLFAGPQGAEIAGVANDSLAEMAAKHPRRLLGVASVWLVDPDRAAREVERAVKELGLVGVQVFSNIRGRPLDARELDGFYSTVEELGVPIWLHPERPENQADYVGEDRSRYGMYLVFGWPYDTTLAMARLVFGGVLKRHPRLKVIVHHAGAMIPFFAKRIEHHYPASKDIGRIEFPEDVDGPYMDYFRRFYVDTVTQGSISALMNAYELYGADRMIFASDMPFGGNDGRDFLREAVESVRFATIPPEEKEKIWSGTLRKLCGLEAGPQR